MGKSTTLHPLYHELRETIEISLLQIGVKSNNDVTRIASTAAAAIMDRYKGSNLYFAYGLPQEREMKKRAIRRAHAHGKSIFQLATEYRCTESWIRRILATPDPNDGNQ